MNSANIRTSDDLNVHVVLSPFTNESRVLRPIGSLTQAKLFQEIHVIALWNEGLAKTDVLADGCVVHRLALTTRSWTKHPIVQLVKYFEFVVRAFFFFSGRSVRVIHCWDLNTLLVGCLFKWFKKAKIVYDPRELATEKYGFVGFRKKLVKILERALIGNADHVFVVSESIGEWYRKTYSLDNVFLLRNVPRRKLGKIDPDKKSYFREKFSIPDGSLLFIYQGNLGKGRGLEVICDVFSRLGDDKHIVFMGYGPIVDTIREFAREYPNIHFKSAVKPNEILDYTCGADVGIAMADGIFLSRFFGMPNKLFEYIHAGLPVVVPDFPERAGFVDRHGCGWKVPVVGSIAAPEVLAIISKLTPDEVREKRQNVEVIRNRFVWEEEEHVLLDRYRALI